MGSLLPTEIRKMVEHMSWESPDVIVLAGDLAETVHNLDRFSDLLGIFTLKFPTTPLLVLSGNHDLWCHSHPNYNSYNSKDLWTTQLPNITESSRGFWLERKNWSRDGIAIVGSYLHYDYSAQDKTGPTSTLPHEYLAANKHRINNDGNYMKGLPDDKTFALEIGKSFRRRLLEAQNDLSIKSIVVITHVPCVNQLVTRKPYNYSWSISTPYFGNLSHEDLIFGCSKVKWIVSAHSHQEISTVFNSPHGKIQLFNLGSDYHKPDYKTIYM